MGPVTIAYVFDIRKMRDIGYMFNPHVFNINDTYISIFVTLKLYIILCYVLQYNIIFVTFFV
jgi:hypothetical protein